MAGLWQPFWLVSTMGIRGATSAIGPNVSTEATTIEKLTLVVAGVAAISSICSAIVTGTLQRRAQRSHWLRESQMNAYQAFYRAIWKSYNDVVTGPTNEALQSPTFAGLDEAWPAVQAAISECFDRHHDVLVVGRRATLESSGLLVGWWQQEATVAVPLRGTVSAKVLADRVDVLRRTGKWLVELSLTMRDDLGALTRKERRDWKRTRSNWKAELKQPAESRSLADLKHELLERGVLRLNGTAPQDASEFYASDMTEWFDIQVRHRTLQAPHAAFLVKYPDRNWQLGIATALEPSDEVAVLTDMLQFVRRNGRTFGVLGGSEWWPEPGGGEVHGWAVP